MDFSTVVEFWSANGKVFVLIFGLFGGTFLMWYVVKARMYLKSSFGAIAREFSGKKKINVVGNDMKIRSHSANFLNDYYMDEGGDKDKMYVLEPHGWYLDEFGEKVWYFNQDGTQMVHFHDQAKFVWVDKITRQPLFDKNGRFVTKLNLLQSLMRKYEKVAKEKLVKVDSFVELGALDEITGFKTILPAIIGNQEVSGIDATATADVINRHLEIESLGFFRKYWQQILIGGIVIIVCVLGALYFGYQNQKEIKLVAENTQFVKDALYNMTVTGGFS